VLENMMINLALFFLVRLVFFCFLFLVRLGDDDKSYMKNVSALEYIYIFLSWFIV
jgi:hypothetical protein